ncbi:unnamed protein product [Protopolystoma xenopodis]|uniref:Uncharacterized protein n=1 Tax=Protopolystoma xenopodis TaxID=117903 RepID=A0A3S5FH31_9PLAT|nr:unnamed protein product [Protopolystoma xenopodis]
MPWERLVRACPTDRPSYTNQRETGLWQTLLAPLLSAIDKLELSSVLSLLNRLSRRTRCCDLSEFPLFYNLRYFV